MPLGFFLVGNAIRSYFWYDFFAGLHTFIFSMSQLKSPSDTSVNIGKLTFETLGYFGNIFGFVKVKVYMLKVSITQTVEFQEQLIGDRSDSEVDRLFSPSLDRRHDDLLV